MIGMVVAINRRRQSLAARIEAKVFAVHTRSSKVLITRFKWLIGFSS
jgi:hypothetical protein